MQCKCAVITTILLKKGLRSRETILVKCIYKTNSNLEGRSFFMYYHRYEKHYNCISAHKKILTLLAVVTQKQGYTVTTLGSIETSPSGCEF